MRTVWCQDHEHLEEIYKLTSSTPIGRVEGALTIDGISECGKVFHIAGTVAQYREWKKYAPRSV